MDDFTSTRQILRESGYNEEVDNKSMPLIAHMLNDIQKLQIQVLSQHVNDNSYEERICILMKELEEVNKQKQEQSVKIEEAQKQIATQNQLIQQLKNQLENNDYPLYSRNEYVEMIQTLTEEKETISKENYKLSHQHVIDAQQLANQSKVIQNQKEEIEKLKTSILSYQTHHDALKGYQKEIEEIQIIYHQTQQELQKQTIEFNACKEREKTLSLQLAEVRNNCRLTEECLRSEKNKNLELLESNTHYQSLLQIQKGSITEYENSLKQEKSLTNQLQMKIESLQRLNGELEQNLRENGGKIETYQKQIKEAEERERETYQLLEEKRKAYDSLLVEQIANRASVERLTSENKIQKEAVERLQKTQDELDQRIRTLQTQESTYLQETGRLKNEIEEKTRLMKEMEEMMNTERTRSLIEISQLKETLLKNQTSFFPPSRHGNETPRKVEKEDHSFPSINETPIKVIDSPIKEKAGFTSTTGLSSMISTLSTAVNELEQQIQSDHA